MIGAVAAFLGATTVTLALVAADPASSAFPGRNGKIVFTRSNSDDAFPVIYTINADGSGATRLTRNGAWSTGPAFSSNGRKIAFTCCEDEDAIYVMKADGSKRKRLTSRPTGTDPAYSADGTKIAYSGSRHRHGGIFLINANGTGKPTRVTHGEYDEGAAFSPTGDEIAFTRLKGSTQEEIYLVNADGTGLTRLTDNSNSDVAPAFSPDGTKIAYCSTAGSTSGCEIYVMNPDGSQLTRLTNNASGDGAPAFSPDGTKIAFVSDRDGNDELYVMNADGSEQTRLTNNTVSDSDPDWQPLAP
jgi:Tol biopolymer transport system component